MENSAVAIYADQTQETVKSYVNEEAATWMFETAQVGEIKLFEDADTDSYYVVKLLSNDVNYLCNDLMQIYIANDEETEEVEETEEDHTGHDHEEEETETTEEDTVLTAAEKLEAVKAGLEADGTEESFRTLASEHSSNTSVDLEDTAYSYLNSYISSDAFLWVLEGRQAGDYETFETADGTYVLYFCGTSETYRNLSVNSALVSEWVEQLTATAVANCKFDLEAALNGSVALTLNTSSSES